ncbi:MAG: glycosyltransferase [Thermoflexales bacterium]|nr:glycosyltransferase [Thermoflexales bacterium]
MNILQIYYEPIPAGQGTHVLALVRGLLQKAKHHVTVALPQNLPRSIAAFEQAGAKVFPLPMNKLLWRPGAAGRLASLIRRQDFDIVHVHSQEAGISARLIARAAGARRIFYTPQTIDIRQTAWHWLYVWVERGLARLTDAIISVNEADRMRMVAWGIPAHKIVTVPNGIDLSTLDEPADPDLSRRAFGLDVAGPVVMQVGRLSLQKDPLTFVEGAAHVVRACPGAQFVLLGEGPLSETLRARIHALGLDAHVHLLGWRSDAALLMAAADVVTLSSRWEGSPHTLLEAMARSRPVVATAVNGCPEIVLDGITGYLSPPGDAAEWARQVARLLNDPAQAAAMGKRGRQRVEEHFGLPEMIARIERLYAS